MKKIEMWGCKTMRTWSIRTHLLLLILVVSVPLLAVAGLAIYFDVQQSIDHTKTSLQILAHTMASNTGRTIDNSRKIIEQVAARPLVVRVDPKNCDGILKDLLLQNPIYANVAYANMEGQIVCSAVPQPGGKLTNTSKTPWFQKILKERRFSIGQPFIGLVTGKFVSVLNTPIWNERHEMVGAVALPLDLKAYDPNIPAHLLPADSHYGFFSEDGTLVWRNVDEQHAIGTRPKADAARQIVKMRNGEFESVAADGVTRFYSVLFMPDTNWIAWVGVPASTVYAEAKKRAIVATATVLVVIVLLLFLAIAIARRITRPVAELERAAREVQGGDLGVRALMGGPRDIAAVAREFNAMVNAQQVSVAQLRIAAAAFEAQESMMITDANSVILRINKAFSDTTGYTAAEIVGQTPRLLQSGRHDADFYRAMWETIKRTGGWQGEIWDRRKNGEVYPKWLSISAVKADDGVITHYIGTHIDITERKRTEAELFAAKHAEAANRIKDTFLAGMSHELRTPLNAILGFGQLLEMDADSCTASQRESVKHILTAGHQLLGLINDILDLSRLEIGELTINIQPLSIADLITDCVDQISVAMANQRNITIESTITNPTLLVQGDNLRLRQVLINLLSNAVKYNKENGRVTICSAVEKEGWLRIEVRDTGDGIASDKLSLLFTPFERIDQKHGTISGVGIGLHITKQLIESMHGTVGVESVQGEGSTFWFELPLAEAIDEPMVAPEKNRQPILHIDFKFVVLYIEDNLTNVQLVKSALQNRTGIELLTAGTAEEGLTIAEEEIPDLILMDIQLPGIDGIAATTLLKGIDATRNIPVVALSADASKENIDKALSAGCSAYLTKPIELRALYEMIDSMRQTKNNA